MAADWAALCRGARDLRVDDDRVEVRFAEGRHHVLAIQDEDRSYHIVGVVAKPAVSATIHDLALQVWRRNRVTKLAGFRVDARGRVLGECFVPKAGLTADEFQQWVRTVARECDRFEQALTGKDVE